MNILSLIQYLNPIKLFATVAIFIVLSSGCNPNEAVVKKDMTENETFSPTSTSTRFVKLEANNETFVTNMKNSRQRHVATVLLNGKLLVTGGTDEFGTSPLAEIYDPLTNIWTPLTAMRYARTLHSATLLPNGKVLVAGGEDSSGRMRRVEIFDPDTYSWETGPDLLTIRGGHTSTLLKDGNILLVGGIAANPTNSVELLDSTTGEWTTIDSMLQKRAFHTATLLNDNRVLVIGGALLNDASGINTAEIYNPVDNSWSSAGKMKIGRSFHTATLISDNRVLVVGGHKNQKFAEIYDPSLNSWTTVGMMEIARRNHTANLMPNGDVLITGGSNSEEIPVKDAEIFEVESGIFKPAGNMDLSRQNHTSTLLVNGKIIIVGGGGTDRVLNTTEFFDPELKRWLVDGSLGSWYFANNLHQSRTNHTATLLPDGKILVTGGHTKNLALGENARLGKTVVLKSAEIYDPISKTWTATAEMNTERSDHKAILINGDKVLVSGGYFLKKSDSENKRTMEVISTAEIYNPTTEVWTTVTDMQIPRQRHSMITLPDNRILVSGGDSGQDALGSAEIYDPDSNTWKLTANMLYQRSFPVMVKIPDNKIMVFGGAEGTSEIFDTATEKWTETGLMSTRITRSAVTTLADGRIISAGGFGPKGSLASAEIYDPNSKSWTLIEPLPEKKVGPTGTRLLNGTILVLGGRFSEAILLNPISLSWTSAGKLSQSRKGHTATITNDGSVVIIGGEARNSSIHASTEIYKP